MVPASSRAGTITTTRGHRLSALGSDESSCTCQKFPRANKRYSQMAKGIAASSVGVRGTRYCGTKAVPSGPFSVLSETRSTPSDFAGLGLACRLETEDLSPKTLSQVFLTNRQTAQALAARTENGVRDRRSNHRDGRLADPGRRFRAGHQINLNRWRLIHADHRIVVEIRLHDPAAVHRDGIFDCCRERINSGAFHLGAYAVGIDRTATIHRANNAIYLESRTRSGDFRNGGHITKEGVEAGDTAALALGKGLRPAGLVGGQLQNTLQTPGIERMIILATRAKLRNLAGFAEKLQAELERILPRGMRQLIHKTLHDETAARVLDRPPPGARCARMSERILDANVRRRIGNGCAGAEFAEPRIVGPLLTPLGGDRSGCLEMFPGSKLALAVQCALQPVIGSRAIKIVVHIVFAGPQHHHRLP